jgi:hypothetical protein
MGGNMKRRLQTSGAVGRKNKEEGRTVFGCQGGMNGVTLRALSATTTPNRSADLPEKEHNAHNVQLRRSDVRRRKTCDEMRDEMRRERRGGHRGGGFSSDVFTYEARHITSTVKKEKGSRWKIPSGSS